MGFAVRSTTSYFCFFAIGIAFYRYIKHLPKARELIKLSEIVTNPAGLQNRA
jgi:hypothetical protein